MKIEAGKRYVRSDGEVTGYMLPTESDHLFLEPSTQHLYDLYGANDESPNLTLIDIYIDPKEAQSGIARENRRYEMASQAMLKLMTLSPDEPYTYMAETAVKIADILLNELEKKVKES
jgi:hypothetical protein